MSQLRYTITKGPKLATTHAGIKTRVRKSRIGWVLLADVFHPYRFYFTILSINTLTNTCAIIILGFRIGWELNQ